MRLYLDAKTSVSDLTIDYIEVELSTGETVSLNWDESEIARENNEFSARYKGVYFDENYANGKLKELKGMRITTIGYYTEDISATPIDHLTITAMEFEDGNEIYEMPDMPITIDANMLDYTG